MLVAEMTHDDIADWCALRLRRMDYHFSFSNMTSNNHGEQPDVLGVNMYGESILVEVKVSRSDFLADKKKPWREDGKGIGDKRIFLTPKGLLKADEIPYGWQLWEVHGVKKPTLKVIKGYVCKRLPHPACSSWSITEDTYPNTSKEEINHFAVNYKTKNCKAELTWMIVIMRRAIEAGFEPNDFANKFQKPVAQK